MNKGNDIRNKKTKKKQKKNKKKVIVPDFFPSVTEGSIKKFLLALTFPEGRFSVFLVRNYRKSTQVKSGLIFLLYLQISMIFQSKKCWKTSKTEKSRRTKKSWKLVCDLIYYVSLCCSLFIHVLLRWRRRKVNQSLLSSVCWCIQFAFNRYNLCRYSFSEIC